MGLVLALLTYFSDLCMDSDDREETVKKNSTEHTHPNSTGAG